MRILESPALHGLITNRIDSTANACLAVHRHVKFWAFWSRLVGCKPSASLRNCQLCSFPYVSFSTMPATWRQCHVLLTQCMRLCPEGFSLNACDTVPLPSYALLSSAILCIVRKFWIRVAPDAASRFKVKPRWSNGHACMHRCLPLEATAEQHPHSAPAFHASAATPHPLSAASRAPSHGFIAWRLCCNLIPVSADRVCASVSCRAYGGVLTGGVLPGLRCPEHHQLAHVHGPASDAAGPL